jgi:glycosyltransferase involved in cell wall biosynthesis
MIKIVFLITACKKSGPVQQMLNIAKHLDKSSFEPYLVTLYPEPDAESLLEKYLPYMKHHYVPTGKLALMTGKDCELRRMLEEIQPGVIHSLGVFPDFAVSRMKKWKQIITLRNFVYEDYPAKFGWLKGNILAKLHLYAMKHTSKTVACSESLTRIYSEKLKLNYDFVRNGVDVEQYKTATKEEKMAVKEELGISVNEFVYVYTGQMIERKNVEFLLETFANSFKGSDVCLLLLGGGEMLDALKEKYGKVANIDFRGNINNVNHYLKACDVYVSTSKSEGLPNGVLEAMATGLPVVLSDIEQHLEIYNVDKGIGYVYQQGNADELAQRLQEIRTRAEGMGKAAYDCAHQHFSANRMSKQYQELYKQIAEQ